MTFVPTSGGLEAKGTATSSGERPRAVARPVHAPATGPFRRLLGRFYFTGVFWYRFHLWGVGFLREWAIPPVVLFFTTVFYLALGRVRRAVDANLTLVLGPAGLLERQRRVFRTLHSFAWCLTERYEQFVPGKSFEFVKTDEHHYLELLARKSGVLVATAHVGCWELGSSIPAEYEGRVMNLIRELELDSEAQDFVRGLIEARADGRYRTHFASDDPTLGFELLDALQRGEMVALPVDRPRRAGRVSRQKLFGKEFDLPIGPVVLARAAGVPILPVFTLREGRRRYRIVFREPIVVGGDASDETSGEAAQERALAQLVGEIEGVVRNRPDQWFCFARIG
jgi:lauroyl/myristoyl acyltransferase